MISIMFPLTATKNRFVKLLAAPCVLLLLAMPVAAQQPPPPTQPPPMQGPGPRTQDPGPQQPGTSVGGKWMEYNAEDRMTAQKSIRLELLADDASDADVRAKIVLFCSDGDLKLSDFRPNTRIAGPDRPSFWGRPQMEVRVRVNDHSSRHSWNWVEGHFLSMDKGTTRELIGANLFRVEFNTPRGPEIAEFSPSGLDLSRVKQACGLTPRKP
jgi:hypothetical protein